MVCRDGRYARFISCHFSNSFWRFQMLRTLQRADRVHKIHMCITKQSMRFILLCIKQIGFAYWNMMMKRKHVPAVECARARLVHPFWIMHINIQSYIIDMWSHNKKYSQFTYFMWQFVAKSNYSKLSSFLLATAFRKHPLIYRTHA